MRFQVTLLLLATAAVAFPAEPGVDDGRDLSGQTLVNEPISRDSSDNANPNHPPTDNSADFKSLDESLVDFLEFQPDAEDTRVAGEMMQALRDDMIALSRLYRAIKNAEVTEAVDLVNKYLQLIYDYDLLPFLQKAQNDPVSTYWAEVIGRNDPNLVYYFLSNIMVFQVIPKIAMLYIETIGLDTAIAFIDAMVENSYVESFWESILDGNEVNYYEQT
ncbi:hypothetical protein H4R35_003309 [Dimargaris xerosporica]|nr:hypothetical protein H4R35_003309 [Dimargaris xerosporica]